ncbi:MAG: hypothetical protein AD742_13665 [Methylibium sp. NZG]|nr:MAG: hypothetical protein AD742_13665 [Methylibium sp. NZG]
MLHRRRLLVAGSTTLLLSGCAAVLGPRNIVVSQERLQALVARRFPVTRRYLELFDVTVAAPRLTLLPELNRLATKLDVSASDRLLRRPMNGSIDLTSALRFDAADNTVRLADVRVDSFVLGDAPGPLQNQLSRIGKLLAEEMLDGEVVYTLKPEDVKNAQGRGYQPGELKVTPRGLVLTLNPSP